MSFLARLGRARRILAQYGVAALVRAVLAYGRRYEYLVYRRRVTEASASFPGSHVRRGSLVELREWRDTQAHVAGPFLADESSGWREFCWVWLEGVPAGILWTAPDSPLLRTDAGEAVIVDLYTVPTFRGRGVASALITGACRRLRDEGIGTVFATVETRNIASQRAFERCGFEAVGRITVQGWLRPPPRTARWRHGF
jgi:ribosomal protein S18 acetylase RimI-like enzyme